MRKSKNQKNTKQKNKQQTDENQMELDFTSKKSASSDTSIQLVNVAKPVKTQCSNTSLPKLSDKGRVREDTCGFKQASRQLIENLINVEELAVVLGLAPQTIRNWVAQRKLPYVKLGRRNMFLKTSLRKWLNQKEKPQWQ